MELDHIIFTHVMKWYERYKAARHIESSTKVCLDDHVKHLTVLARALTGHPVDILESTEEGGFRGETMFLPAFIDLYEDAELNAKHYVFRVYFIAQQMKMGHAWGCDESHSLDESRAQAQVTAPEVIEAVATQFPNIEQLHSSLLVKLQERQQAAPEVAEQERFATHWIYGRWMREPENSPVKGESIDRDVLLEDGEIPEEQTQIKAKAAEEVETIEVDQQKKEEYTLLHQFEKVETLDEFDGSWRDMDGSDELEDHKEALEELNLSQTVRVEDAVHSVMQAEYLGNGTTLEVKDAVEVGTAHNYWEWDTKKGAYLLDHCTVYHRYDTSSSDGFMSTIREQHAKSIAKLKRLHDGLRQKHQTVHRVADGPEIHFDSSLAYFVDRHCGATPDERLYSSSRKNERDMAVLLLADTSLSTDGYVNNEKVLDIEKTTLGIVGEVLNYCGDMFQIDTFHSQTRNNCAYTSIKNFGESWQVAQNRIGSIQAAGYTRIGPALRHACTQFESVESKHKWIVLLSDGKPNDYDRYEGRHGVKDVSKAISEAENQGIKVFGIAVDEKARDYLPVMLGTNQCRVVKNSSEIPASLFSFIESVRFHV